RASIHSPTLKVGIDGIDMDRSAIRLRYAALGREHDRARAVRADCGPDEGAHALASCATLLECRADGDRRELDRLQHRLARYLHALAHHDVDRREPGFARSLSGAREPSELGRHSRAAADLQPPHSAAALLPQEPVVLGAAARTRVVGTRLPIHEAPLARTAGAP